jgi:hypothetical protein
MSEHAAAIAAKPYVHFALGDVACAMPLAAIAGVRLLGEFELRDAQGERADDGGPVDGHVGVAERQHYAAWDLSRLLGIEQASFGCWLLLQVQRSTGPVPLAVRVGKCLAVHAVEPSGTLPASVFRARRGAISGVFDPRPLRHLESSVIGLFCDPEQLLSTEELSESRQRVERFGRRA